MILYFTSAALAIGAALDGKSTHDCISSGNVEDDPIAVFFFRTDTPSWQRLLFIGGAVIAAEIAAGFIATHFWGVLALVIAALQQSAQAAAHIFYAIQNWKGLAASKVK